MKKLFVTLSILAGLGFTATAQDSMNKKMENKSDKMVKKMENKTDKMNKKLENKSDKAEKKVDTVARRKKPVLKTPR